MNIKDPLQIERCFPTGKLELDLLKAVPLCRAQNGIDRSAPDSFRHIVICFVDVTIVTPQVTFIGHMNPGVEHTGITLMHLRLKA